MLSQTDRFGKQQFACLCKPETTKDGKQYAKGYVELNGRLWRVTVSGSNKYPECRWVNFSPARKNGSNYSY